ncbi:MAG: polysaccharide pyruvyl transferase family protein [Nitrosospira sp.]
MIIPSLCKTGEEAGARSADLPADERRKAGDPMKERVWEIAICGTFDVQNYGDLLFPIIAEAELARRLGPVKLHRLSYHARTPPEWPYAVTSLTQLPELAMSLDGILIGGGFIIRFDKEVAPGYGPPNPEIHHPTGYWLTPALIALQHGIPLAWNAPGMHCNDIPQWGEPLVRLVFQGSRHIRVRDEPSREALRHFCCNSQIAVLPDTAFGISRLVDSRRPSAELETLRALSGLAGPYIIVQAIHCIAPFIRFMQNHRQLFKGLRFLILPIGPVLGDHETVIGDGLPDCVQLPAWPHPLLLAELISQAEAVVGHSYHLAITALAFGVPIFSSADLATGKYTALSAVETVFALPGEDDDPHLFLKRLGRGRPALAAHNALEQLDQHWDRIAEIIREGKADTKPALNRFWQSLPNLLEAASEHAKKTETEYAGLLKDISLQAEKYETECATLREAATRQAEAYRMEGAVQQRHVEELEARLSLANSRIAALYNSRSFRITAPLRHIVRRLSVNKGMGKSE